MAGADRMTIEEVVRKVLLDEHADVIREAVKAVAAEMMELEVSELIGAERGERRPEDRATHRNGYRAAALGHARRRDGVADPQAPAGQLLPELFGAAQAQRAGAVGRRPAGLCLRRLDAAGRPAGRAARAADLQVRCQPRLREARRARRGVPDAAVGGPLPVSVSRREDGEGPRRRPRRRQGAGRSRTVSTRPAGGRSSRSMSARPRPRRSGRTSSGASSPVAWSASSSRSQTPTPA